MDEQGVVCSMGNLCNDTYFRQVAAASQQTMDFESTVEELSSLAVVITTGCLEVRPLTAEEISTYQSLIRQLNNRRCIVITDTIVPQRTELKASCGWRLGRIYGKRGLADAMMLGPNIRKTRLNIPRALVEEWVRNAPSKTTLWSPREGRRLPKLLIVLEEWISPSWTYVYSDENGPEPGPSAIGLATLSKDACPEWRFLALQKEALSAPMRIGNTEVYGLYLHAKCRRRKIGLLQSTAYPSISIQVCCLICMKELKKSFLKWLRSYLCRHKLPRFSQG